MEFSDAIILQLLSTCYRLNGPLKRDEYYVFQNKEKASNTKFQIYINITFDAFHVIRDFLHYNNTNDMVCNIEGYTKR